MREFPNRIFGVKKTVFPRCPSCLQPKLKQRWVGHGKDEKQFIMCMFCGWNFEKQKT